MKNRSSEIFESVRMIAALQVIIPIEAAFGYPVPYTTGNRVYLRMPVYFMDLNRELKQSIIYQPYWRVSLNYPTGTLAELVEYDLLAKGLTHPKSNPVGVSNLDITMDELRYHRKNVLDATDSIAQALLQGQIWAAEVVRKYLFGIQHIVPNVLTEYYRELNPVLFGSLQE